MSLAKEINTKLDEILSIKSEMNRMLENINADAQITNIKTGQKVDVEEANKVVDDMLSRIFTELNKITNNGKRAKGLFDNIHYVNDVIQDQLIVKQEKEQDKPK
jgi:hypothetical protein